MNPKEKYLKKGIPAIAREFKPPAKKNICTSKSFVNCSLRNMKSRKIYVTMLQLVQEENYKAILNYQMPSDELNAIPVYTIRSPKPRPDDKPKNEFYAWENLVELNWNEE